MLVCTSPHTRKTTTEQDYKHTVIEPPLPHQPLLAIQDQTEFVFMSLKKERKKKKKKKRGVCVCVIPKTTFSPPVANVSKPPAVLNDFKKHTCPALLLPCETLRALAANLSRGKGGCRGGWGDVHVFLRNTSIMVSKSSISPTHQSVSKPDVFLAFLD